MKKALRSAAVAIGVICTVAMIFIYPDLIKSGISEGLSLCAEVIIPSMFIFAVTANFAAESGAAPLIARPLSFMLSPLLKIPKCAAATVLMSFITGYPIGAAGVRRLYDDGLIDRHAALRLLAVCANASPTMVIVAIGGLLDSYTVGWIMYLSHIAASLIIGAATALFAKKPSSAEACVKKASVTDAFVHATADASSQMLIICAWVVLFSAVGKIITPFIPSAAALLEVTSGAHFAVKSGYSVPFIAGIIGFGGVSVICQIMSIARGIATLGELIFMRVANGIISAAICSLLLKIFGGSIEVMSNLGAQAAEFAVVTLPASIAMLAMAATFLCSVRQKN